MKTLHRIVSDIASKGTVTKVDISRRELAKIRAELKRPVHPTVTTQLMAHPRHHEHKVRWPTRDTTFVLHPETDRTEHPMVTARRRQYRNGR